MDEADLEAKPAPSRLQHAAGTLARSIARACADVLFPPECLACRAPVSEPRSLCAACWSDLAFITAPLCARCGVPFDYDPGLPEGETAICAGCTARPPIFHRARSVMRYDDASRGLLLAFKHVDRLEGAPAFGRWLARAAQDLLGDTDVLVPVPLHRRRLFARRYNQSAILAQALGAQCGLRDDPLALVRNRPTPSQGGLSARQRRRNVAGAFQVTDKAKPRLEGLKVLLVDDVYTTGATVNACARALRRAGARAVDVVTLARVVKPEDTSV